MSWYVKAENQALSPLKQTEILTDVLIPKVQLPEDKAQSMPLKQLSVVSKHYAFLIILSQGCDLSQDFTYRSSGKTTHHILNNIVACEGLNIGSFYQKEGLYGEWCSQKSSKKISNHQIDRFYNLPELSVEEDAVGSGVAEGIIVDFKNTLSIDADYLYYLLRHGCEVKRRAYLKPPYKEHFVQRFTQWHSRVVLPTPEFV